MALEIALLGEVTARVDGRSVDLGPARQRCVLAALAVDAGQLVGAEQVLARVWGADTPRRGRATLHSHISRLRKAFAGGLTIVHRSGGYMLMAGQAVDLLRFHDLRDRARGTGDDTRTVALLTEALALWRGEPLTGLSGQWVESERDRWLQERSAAEYDLIDARLRIGHGEELLAPLSARAARYPLDERVGGQYMLALHHAGRAADALAQYRQIRERLIEELGTDPGSALQDLHRKILAADPSLLPATGGAVAEPVVLPRQLPAAPTPFVGRRDELDRLDAALRETVTDTVVISAMAGAGGIGKTWLALHWAHHHRDQFPDGHLFVDLQGFSPTGDPMPPAVAVRGFLVALGIDPGRIPADLDAQAALYRSTVAGKRMLIVLDNAATTDQVEPLLPGTATCTVLVTGRTKLATLITRYGARHLQLDILTHDEAHALLDKRLGHARVTANPYAANELIRLCGRYPLALAIVARYAHTRPHIPLAEFATELRELGVEALDNDDPAASLPTVLSWSLRGLTDEQRTVFVLLGIAPGPDIGLPAAASLIGLPQRHTSKILGVLEDASLLTRQPGSRYTMHDLIRGYAATTAHDNLRGDVREAALRRVVDFYLHTAHAADRLLEPHRQPMEFDPPVAGCHPHTLPGTPAALAWFDTEYPCLLATQHIAATQHWHQVVWRLAWTLTTFHHRRGHRHDRLAVWRAALTAADHLSEPIAHTAAHRYLGYAYAELGLHDEAIEHLRQALTLAEHHHDHTNQAHAHQALAWACELRGDDRRALEHASHALRFFRIVGNPVWEAWMLNAVGWYSARLGDHDQARDHCHAALALYRRHPEPHGAAHVLDSLGYIEHHAGHHEQAIRHYQQALILFRDLGNAYELAETLDGLGRPHITLGQHAQAGAVWREALELFRDQGRNEDAERVQRQLDDLASALVSNRSSDAGDNPQSS